MAEKMMLLLKLLAIFTHLELSTVVNVEHGRVLPVVLATFHKFVVVLQFIRVVVVENIVLKSTLV